MQATFNINGMHCESCAIDIKETLEDTDGVRSAEVSFTGAQAVVDFDEASAPAATLIEKIRDLNYTATIAGSSPEQSIEGKI